MGVVPWKHGFSADIDTYQSRIRRKAEEAKNVRALEERVATIESALAASKGQQDAPSVPNVESSPGLSSQRRSSVASTEHLAADQTEMVGDNEQRRYPVDDITVRTPCELLYQQRKKIKVVAHDVAEIPVEGGTIHGAPIPEGYARVMVDRVKKGWEDLDLEIPGGDGEQELQQAHHTWICWNKQYIRFPGGTTDPAASPKDMARSRSPTPQTDMGLPSAAAQRGPSMDLPSPAAQMGPDMDPPSSPAAQMDHNMDPPSPASQREPSTSSSPPKVKKNAKRLGSRHRHLLGRRRPNL
ncbi:transposon protein, putative, CACTA, En/Spm sub-class [Panicum miliaceum]|uniref:Transposon protein, putative, CACTA, En/Spm sub-class n=1 Tax=Panicum miliaceum TaxID=4540 RepID=A0A3L6T4X7_PANMI|nr:transposon protein, putative, CACTA, En/Spm sub-class [Panicum miliaceum]